MRNSIKLSNMASAEAMPMYLVHVNLGFYRCGKLDGNKKVILPNAADTCNRGFEVQVFSTYQFITFSIQL